MLRLLFALGFALAALPAQAMQFRLVQSAGQVAVLATGAIGPGDADRLAAALRRATRDRHGTKELLISSVGGVVAEAWAMADVINQVGVTTIVPAGSLCASACASVVFVAGKYRTIQKGGQLAIHSCFDDRNGQKMDDCDALISARAEQEGISGRAMMAFQEMAPGPDSAIVFDPANAACFGLTRAPGKASLGDYYTSAYDGVIFDRSLKKNIVFADHSLSTDSVFSEVQLVSCRNVLIYFNRALQDRAVGLFRDALVRGGFLGLGNKESLQFGTHADAFEPVVREQRIYRKIAP